MNLTRDQYESAFMRAIAYFSLAVGAATALEVGVIAGTTLFGIQDQLGAAIGSAILFTLLAFVFAIIVAGIGSAIVTLVLGLGLTVLAARMLRDVDDWHRHFAGYFAIGAVAALVPALWVAWDSVANVSPRDIAGDWLLFLDLAIIVVLAGASTSLAWYHVWRHPADVETEAESVIA
jgi:hypothetical protein